MNEETKQIIALFTAVVVGIAILAASIIGYNRDQTNCVVLAAKSGWSAKDAKDVCK